MKVTTQQCESGEHQQPKTAIQTAMEIESAMEISPPKKRKLETLELSRPKPFKNNEHQQTKRRKKLKHADGHSKQ